LDFRSSDETVPETRRSAKIDLLSLPCPVGLIFMSYRYANRRRQRTEVEIAHRCSSFRHRPAVHFKVTVRVYLDGGTDADFHS